MDDMNNDEIIQEYLKELTRTLGKDYLKGSRVYWSGGWFYYKDALCRTNCLRKKDVLQRIVVLKQRSDFVDDMKGER